MAPEGVSVHVSRVHQAGAQGEQSSYQRMADGIATASSLLATAEVDVIAFGCTSCTYYVPAEEIHAPSASYWIRSGQLVRNDLESRLDATIGEILLGRKSIEKNKRTLAIIQGMAVCDLAFAKTVLDRASQEAEPRSLKRT